MGKHSRLITDLADRLKRMELRSVAYFHTDHFEPWRSVDDRIPAVGQEIVDSFEEFVRACERIDFARRLTLFYKPHLNYALSRDRDMVRAHPDDLVGFLQRSEPEERYGRAAMQHLATGSRHEIQLHVHHEYYTASKSHTDPAAIEWFAGPLGHKLDAARLELALRLNREIIVREYGSFPDEWFFVHGQWALNGSDEEACTITNEIEVLMRNGCRGDFTFPAARGVVNPRIQEPYFCRPLDLAKCYDCYESEPEIAAGNRNVAQRKFFIWSCAASSVQCSLDYMSEASKRHLANTEKAAKALIDGSYRHDGGLFIKTHAHSMHGAYFEYSRDAVFPHQYPATQTVLSVIFDAAASAGIEVRFITASEAYDSVVGTGTKPETDLVATYLRSNPIQVATGWALKRSANGHGAPSPAASATPVAATIEMVRDAAAAVLRPRIERLGVERSGAYEHYNTMLARGFPLPDYELAVLDLIGNKLPRVDAYHEVGCGLGTLSFLLALNGFQAVGIENDKGRYDTAAAIWPDLAAKAGIDRSRCQLLYGTFPRVVGTHDVSRSMAILTDFVTKQTPSELAAIYDGLAAYRYVLIDLYRFLDKRDSAEDREKLLADFRAHGFSLRNRFSDPSEQDYTFALFDNAPMRTRRRPRRGVLPRVQAMLAPLTGRRIGRAG